MVYFYRTTYAETEPGEKQFLKQMTINHIQKYDKKTEIQHLIYSCQIGLSIVNLYQRTCKNVNE